MVVNTVHHFVIEPQLGVGPIRFGMHKDEVIRAFTYVYSSFFKVPWSKVRSDQCEVVGLIIHYDDASRANYIEVHKARYATVTLELFGQDITDISLRGLVELLESRSVKADKTDYGYDLPQVAMNTYNHDLKSEDDSVECLGVGLVCEQGNAESVAAADGPRE